MKNPINKLITSLIINLSIYLIPMRGASPIILADYLAEYVADYQPEYIAD
jgi:hypothetical protein